MEYFAMTLKAISLVARLLPKPELLKYYQLQPTSRQNKSPRSLMHSRTTV
jgi:hypothetical protein